MHAKCVSQFSGWDVLPENQYVTLGNISELEKNKTNILTE